MFVGFDDFFGDAFFVDLGAFFGDSFLADLVGFFFDSVFGGSVKYVRKISWKPSLE